MYTGIQTKKEELNIVKVKIIYTIKIKLKINIRFFINKDNMADIINVITGNVTKTISIELKNWSYIYFNYFHSNHFLQ